MAIAIMASTVAVLTTILIAMLCAGKIMLVRAFDYSFTRYAAGVYALQGDDSFPKELTENLAGCAHMVFDKKFIRHFVEKKRPLGSPSEEDMAILRNLTEEQANVYFQTAYCFLLALSFTAVRGSRYRRYLLERGGDRKAVATQTKAVSEHAPARELCAA